jgi:MFS family permease
VASDRAQTTPQAIWLLVNLPARRRVLAALALPGVVGAALLPIALNVSEPAKTSIPGSFGERLVQLPKQLLVGFGLYSPGERAIVVSAGLLVLLGAALVPWLGDRLERRGALVAGALGVAGVVAVLLLAAVGLDYLNTRNMIGLWLPFAIVASCGLGARAAGRWGVAAAVALCALSVGAVIAVDVHRPYQRDDWRGAVRALGRSAEPRVIVATPSSATVPFEVYLPRATVVRTPAVTVREIDLLALALRSAPGHEPEPPPPTAVSPVGFTLVNVRRDRMFTVLRYRAAAPVSVSTAQLVAMRLQGVDAAVELDP